MRTRGLHFGIENKPKKRKSKISQSTSQRMKVKTIFRTKKTPKETANGSRWKGSSAWCSELGSLTSLDACNSGAANDVRQPISLHQAVRNTIEPWSSWLAVVRCDITAQLFLHSSLSFPWQHAPFFSPGILSGCRFCTIRPPDSLHEGFKEKLIDRGWKASERKHCHLWHQYLPDFRKKDQAWRTP